MVVEGEDEYHRYDPIEEEDGVYRSRRRQVQSDLLLLLLNRESREESRSVEGRWGPQMADQGLPDGHWSLCKFASRNWGLWM